MTSIEAGETRKGSFGEQGGLVSASSIYLLPYLNSRRVVSIHRLTTQWIKSIQHSKVYFCQHRRKELGLEE